MKLSIIKLTLYRILGIFLLFTLLLGSYEGKFPISNNNIRDDRIIGVWQIDEYEAVVITEQNQNYGVWRIADKRYKDNANESDSVIDIENYSPRQVYYKILLSTLGEKKYMSLENIDPLAIEPSMYSYVRYSFKSNQLYIEPISSDYVDRNGVNLKDVVFDSQEEFQQYILNNQRRKGFFDEHSLLPQKTYYNDRKGKDYALLIGIDNYENWPDLNNPIKDIHAIGTDLWELYGFIPNYLESSNKDEIFSALKVFRNYKFEEDAQLLIILSGHGEYNKETDEGFFIPSDAEYEDKFEKTYISYSRLKKAIDNIPCNHILVIIDACYSGSFQEKIIVSRSKPLRRPGETDKFYRDRCIAEMLRPNTRLYFTSGGKEERTSDGLNHSPLTEDILRALRSNGGEDNILTHHEIYNYFIDNRTKPLLGSFGKNEISSSFIFIRN